MSSRKRGFVVTLLGIAVFLCSSGLEAATVLQMNLESLCDRSDKIFRGLVIDIDTDTVEAGGGEIPITKYLVEVKETFKGEFGPKPVVEIRQLGSKASLAQVSGNTYKMPLFAGLPALSVGEEYLLFTTAPSAIGLSTTVGLGHGCFHISSVEKTELVVNEFDNVGIFDGISGMPASGPVTYTDMAGAIAQGLN